MSNLVRLTCVSTLAVVALTAPVRADLVLKDSDRVVLFGDMSLSEATLPQAIDQFLHSKYPKLKAEVICLYAPNSDAADGNRRLEIEVLPFKPTRVVLSFGLRAPQRKAFDRQLLNVYLEDMGRMIDKVTESGAKVAVLTPPPPNESRAKWMELADYGGVIARYAEALRKLGAEKKVAVIDWHAAGKEYLEAHRGVSPRYSSKHALKPSYSMAAIATDLLLRHWQAEPLNYIIGVDWASSAAPTATMGTAKVAGKNGARMEVALTGVPVAMDMTARGTVPPRDWPTSKWCNYRIKIAHAPAGGVIISEAGRARKPFLAQQLLEGADLSAVGPLADNRTSRALRNAISIKHKQYRQFREFVHRKVPEPELKEGYRMWAAAQKALAIGTHQILLRTPARFNMTVTIESARKAQKNKPTGGKKQPAPRKKNPSRPNG